MVVEVSELFTDTFKQDPPPPHHHLVCCYMHTHQMLLLRKSLCSWDQLRPTRILIISDQLLISETDRHLGFVRADTNTKYYTILL